MNKSLKYTLLSMFIILGVVFLGSSIMVVLNHYFQYEVSKISVEFESSVIFGIGSFVISILFFLLSWGLYKSRLWFFRAYIACLAILYILFFSLFSPVKEKYYVSDFFFLILFLGLPTYLFFVFKKWHNNLAESSIKKD